MDTSWPAYLDLHHRGELKNRAAKLRAMLEECRLCPHDCGADRTEGKAGYCKAPDEAYFSSAYPHHGNESVISGWQGSGNIFLTFCNSRCVFCQNHDVSQQHIGQKITVEELAEIYLQMQRQNCHNVDFVSPTHFVPQIVSALEIAVESGFRLPLVYNTNGYDSVETLQLLDGIIDIYLPDFKFGEKETGKHLTGMKNYPQVAAAAVAEMYHQVGLLDIDENGIARRGLIVRHLVLPNNAGATETVLKSIAAIDPLITVNLMAQYHPAFKARDEAEINRNLKLQEYREAVQMARDLKLKNVWTQNRRLI